MSEPTVKTTARYTPCQHRSPHRANFDWPTVESFIRAGTAVEDGLHTIHLPHGPHLDVLLLGRPLDPAHGVATVFFNGAVTNRATKTAPFLSGSGAAKAVDVPLISIADPSLRLNGEIGLAWYLGSAGANAQEPVTTVLRHVADVSSNHLLMVGGSGGGFAALQQAQSLGQQASAFVWNPQTDPLRYVARIVKEYLVVAFPELTGQLDDEDWRTIARRRLDEEGIQSDLAASFADGFRMKRLLWLQNWNDWHTKSHMVPLTSTMPGLRELWPGITGTDEEHVVWLTEAGNGHAPPPAPAVQDLLAGLVRHKCSVLSVAKWAEARRMFARDHREEYVRDLRGLVPLLQGDLDFVFSDGRKIRPVSGTVDPVFGGLRFQYRLLGGDDVLQEKYGALGSTYVVPEGVGWDHVCVRVLDGFDHELFSVRFLNPGMSA